MIDPLCTVYCCVCDDIVGRKQLCNVFGSVRRMCVRIGSCLLAVSAGKQQKVRPLSVYI